MVTDGGAWRRRRGAFHQRVCSPEGGRRHRMTLQWRSWPRARGGDHARRGFIFDSSGSSFRVMSKGPLAVVTAVGESESASWPPNCFGDNDKHNLWYLTLDQDVSRT
jgi:hypothetical protein